MADKQVNIKILRATVVAGKRVAVDEVVSASVRDAKFLVAIGKAELAPSKAKTKAK